MTLDCATDSHDANIGSVFFGQVAFVPIGKQHNAEAVNVLDLGVARAMARGPRAAKSRVPCLATDGASATAAPRRRASAAR